jgi:hypothetical protein
MACSACLYSYEDCPDCTGCTCSDCTCDDSFECGNCGGRNCPGYCDDYATYNLRPAETGGQ